MTLNQIKKFCPKCGKTNGKFVKNFCLDCYLKDHEIVLVPKEIQIEQCKKCGKIKFRQKFFPLSEEVLEKILEQHLRLKEIISPKIFVEFSELDNGKIIALVSVKGKIDNLPINVEKSVLLNPKIVSCDECMKLSCNYHEAILQIRAKPNAKLGRERQKMVLNEITQLLLIESENDPLSKAIEEKQKPEGIDLFIGSNRAAKKVAIVLGKKFNSKPVVSFKLIGATKTGEVKKRFTYCVRV